MTPTDTAGAETGHVSTPSRIVERAEAWLLARTDVAWLAAFRMLFGLALGVSMQRFLAHGWVDELLVSPRYRFHYWGFSWVAPLSRTNMHALFWALSALGIAVAAGFAFRVTAPLFAAGLTYVQLVDVSTYLNHYYLAGLLAWLLAVSPAAKAWSVDAWLARKLRARFGKPEPRDTSTVPFAWHALFRVQIGVVYVFAALAKAQPDWLLHGQPLGIWLGARTDIPLLGRLFTVPHVPLAMSWAGFLFDATIVGWLSFRRTRPFAYAVVIVFHVLTRMLFDIGMFPVIMSLGALVFFDASWPRSLLRRLRRVVLREDAATNEDVTARAIPVPRLRASLPGRVGLGLGVVYVALQVLMPIRGFFYGGNVLWHEQGMRYSWRVMVRAKGGSVTFFVKSKTTGKTWIVSPRKYLTPYQENEMASQPDLVLQLAHTIGEDFAAREGEVAVYAEALVSLNARPGVPLVDPAVDLMTVKDGVGPASYVMPGPVGPPPPTRPVL